MVFEFELDLTDANRNEISILINGEAINNNKNILLMDDSFHEVDSDKAILMFSDVFDKIEDIKEILLENKNEFDTIVLSLRKTIGSERMLEEIQEFWNCLNLFTFEDNNSIYFTGDDPFFTIALIECVLQDFALECFGLELEEMCQKITDFKKQIGQQLNIDFDLLNRELEYFFK